MWFAFVHLILFWYCSETLYVVCINTTFFRSNIEVTVENLIEYQWPQNDKNAEHYMILDQVSEYLGVKSFRRRYPDLKRRQVEPGEKEYLQERNVISSTLCDIGKQQASWVIDEEGY